MTKNRTLGVIPTFARKTADIDMLRAAVKSVKATAPQLDLIIVDDASPPRWAKKVARLAAKEGCLFHQQEENGGFSRAVNVGLRLALKEDRDALLINADIEARDEGWFEAMDATDGDVIGAHLLYPSGLTQHAGVYFSLLTRTFLHIGMCAPPGMPEINEERECPVTGALMLIRLESLRTYGIFDEAYGLGFEDMDYCLRVFSAGGRCVYQPEAVALHHESPFRGRRSEATARLHMKSHLRFAETWGKESFYRWCRPL